MKGFCAFSCIYACFCHRVYEPGGWLASCFAGQVCRAGVQQVQPESQMGIEFLARLRGYAGHQGMLVGHML